MSRRKAIYRKLGNSLHREARVLRCAIAWSGSAKSKKPACAVERSSLINNFDALRSLRQEVRRNLLAEAAKHSATKLLREIPFIGPLREAFILAIL